MPRTPSRLTVCLILALLCTTTGSLRAEVSAEPNLTEVSVVLLGIIEGPDPIPQGIWEPVRPIDPPRILNPSGAARGDGPPDVAIDPETGWPHVVWAYDNGTDYDIAYSRWDGDGWTATEFLTAGPLDDIDPRVHVADDQVFVVWWVEQTSTVWLVGQTGRGPWDAPEQLDGLTGMRPSVVTWGGTVLVASETDDGQGGKQILLSTRLEPHLFDTQFVGSTSEDLRLDVVLHESQGRLWMDWKHTSSEFAYSEFAGDVWAPATTLPWTEHSWVAAEEMRQVVRSRILQSP